MSAHVAKGTIAVVMTVYLAFPMVAAADVEPSPAMKEIMKAQAERARRGDKDLCKFRSDLRGPAEAGDPVAQFMLATLLVNEDRESSMRLMRSSAEKGCAGAAGVLALDLFARKSTDAERWLKLALEGGDASSMMFMSSVYHRGEHGYPRSYKDSLAWAELAKARSHSRGLSMFLEQFSEKLRREMSTDQLVQAAALLRDLERKYPNKAFYLCGQGAP